MKDIQVKRRKLTLKDYRNRSAVESDFETLIDEDCRLFEGDRLLCVYRSPVQSLAWLTPHCQAIRYDKSARTSGLMSTSKVFGQQPRNKIRHDWCYTAVMARQQPQQHDALMRAGKIVSDTYKESNGDLWNEHSARTREKVGEDWQLSEVPFTSGIVNENNPLKYHFDAGNYKGVWSGMVCLKKHISGGYLAMPEFGLGIACRHGMVFFFDGQSILHGVTPIRRMKRDAKRYTVVYYSMQGIWSCLPLTEEIERARASRTETERNMTAGI